MRVKHLFFGHLRSGTFCALARGRGHGVAGRIEWHALMHFYDNVIIIVKQRSARPRRGNCHSNASQTLQYLPKINWEIATQSKIGKLLFYPFWH